MMAERQIVITGASGMLGSALMKTAPETYNVFGVDLAQGDLTLMNEAQKAIAPLKPDTIIHCAAYTDVDGCTRDPERAYLFNATATENVARICADLGAHLITLSTDYVFDGQKNAPYTESDPPNPQNPYGASKLKSEYLAKTINSQTLIVRTQWLYGPWGRNFVNTILRKGQELDKLRIVSDEYGCPTFTLDLAHRIWELVKIRPTGTIHCTNSDICTWAELARTALKEAGMSHVKVEDISWRDWKSPTSRPHYSALSTLRNIELGLKPLRHWRQALQEHIAQGI